MRELYARKEPPGVGLQPPPEELLAEPGQPFPYGMGCKQAVRNKGTRRSIYGGEKVYLGVRVRMPVRELLRNIRVPGGMESDDFDDRGSKKDFGIMKRARSRSRTKTSRVRVEKKGQAPAKSLEELTTILEVLEEDLRSSCPSHSPSQNLSPSYVTYYPEPSPTDMCYGDKYDEIIPSQESYTSFSPTTSEYDTACVRPDCRFFSFQPSSVSDIQMSGNKEYWSTPKSYWDGNSNFFWKQLQKEENLLRAASDAELLTTDEHGRTLLHKVVCMGKRPQTYALARRMALINSLDLKDSDGMTALLYAAKYNQHLMVADLIQLGANVNEKNNQGKSCLHLCAENGYIRVLEVLKQAMMEGVYVDVEATNNSGMTVLQCASVALKTAMSEVDSSSSLIHSKLQTLRQDHMMETLKCVLQMDSYLHAAAPQSLTGVQEYTPQSWLNSQQVCPAGYFGTPTVMF